MNTAIPINLVNNVSPTLMARAESKARIEYYIGGGKSIWRYLAFMVIKDE